MFFWASIVLCSIIYAHGASVAFTTEPLTHSPWGALVQTDTADINGKYVGDNMIFLGIPFAHPPVGEYRFKPPADVIPVPGIWPCFDYKPACIQGMGSGVAEDEDCLYLNVMTSTLDTNKNLPVLVFIHGGGFEHGYTSMIPVNGVLDNIVSKGVVFASIPYRLNAFGFFAADDSDIDQNLGMLDQLFALNWIKRNIRNFGGDPNKITLMGQSAGAISASLHTYSPLSNGLFNQVALNSGSPWMAGGYIVNKDIDTARSTSKQFAIATGCVDEDSFDAQSYGNMTQCFQSLSVDQINQAANAIPVNKESTHTQWCPSVGQNDFLPDYPDNLLANRIAPKAALIGSNRDEATFVDGIGFGHFNPNRSKYLHSNESSFSKMGVSFLQDMFGSRMTDEQEVTIHFNYANHSFIPANDFYGWSNATDKMASANMVFYGNQKQIMNDLKQGVDVFQYSFEYLSDTAEWAPFIKAIPHGYELNFIFGDRKNMVASDSEMSEFMATAYTNFVKSGNPNMPSAFPKFMGEALQMTTMESPHIDEWKHADANNPDSCYKVSSTPTQSNCYWADYVLWNNVLRSMAKANMEPTDTAPTTAATEVPLNDASTGPAIITFTMMSLLINLLVQ